MVRRASYTPDRRQRHTTGPAACRQRAMARITRQLSQRWVVAGSPFLAAPEGLWFAASVRYEADYAELNSGWHVEDAEDKVAAVLKSIERARLHPQSICDIGCGSGDVLARLHRTLGTERAVGYDISRHAIELASRHSAHGLRFVIGGVQPDVQPYDLMLLLDVVEHVPEPVSFLMSLRDAAPCAIMNIPLELCVLKVLSADSLARGRRALGHVHYFNERVVYELLREAGYSVTDAWFSPPGTGRVVPEPWRRALRAAQRVATGISPRIAARTIGGSSLMVAAAAA
jgi:SAM-dependent methyltransferase